MNVLRHTEPGFSQRLRALSNASSLFDPTIEERARAIVEAVRTRGDKALLEFTERLDGARLALDQLAVSAAELLDASLQAVHEPDGPVGHEIADRPVRVCDRLLDEACVHRPSDGLRPESGPGCDRSRRHADGQREHGVCQCQLLRDDHGIRFVWQHRDRVRGHSAFHKQ